MILQEAATMELPTEVFWHDDALHVAHPQPTSQQNLTSRLHRSGKADNAKQTKHPSSASNRREAEESEEVATKSKTAKIAPEDE